jgi:DNA-binding transcriptional LysR family regulator
MDIDYLRTFVAICDLGGFTAAAREVGRTQSAVSLQVRRMEDQLGRPLFLRGKGNLQLTPHGEKFLLSARRIVAAYDEALLSFDRSSVSGNVTLGVPEDYAPRLVNGALAEFAALYPQATIDLVLDESKTLSRLIVEGTVDLAFITEGQGIPLPGAKAFSDRVVWVSPAGSDIHARDPLPVAVWGEQDSYAEMMLSALAEIGRRHRIAARSRSMAGLRVAVTAGLAVTVMAESSKTDGMVELTPEDGFPALPTLSVKLVRAKARRTAAIGRLEEHLLAALRQP